MTADQRGHTANLVESQSSQILAFVTAAGDFAPAVNREVSEQNASANRALQVASDSSGSIRPYNLHGLAATQPESQLTEYVSREDSQKENTPAFSLSEVVTSTPPPAKRSSSGDKLNGAPPAAGSSSGPLSARPPPQEAIPSRNTKIVTFTSPTPSPLHKGQQSGPMRYRGKRSPSPASQDSFAGPPVTEDPDLFVASSRQFGRPLEELVQSQSQSEEESQSLPSVSRSLSVRRAATPPERVERLASPEMKSSSLSSRESDQGRILVANSDESANNSQASGTESQGLSQSTSLGAVQNVSQDTQNTQQSNMSFESTHTSIAGTQIVENNYSQAQARTPPDSLDDRYDDHVDKKFSRTNKDCSSTDQFEVSYYAPLESVSRAIESSVVAGAGTSIDNSHTASGKRASLFDGLSNELKKRYLHLMQQDNNESLASSALNASVRATAGTSAIAESPVIHSRPGPSNLSIIPSSSSPPKGQDQTSSIQRHTNNHSPVHPDFAPLKTSYIRSSARYAAKPGMEEIVPPSEPDRTAMSSGPSRVAKEKVQDNSSSDEEEEESAEEESDAPLMSKVKKTVTSRTPINKGKVKESSKAATAPRTDKGKGKATDSSTVQGLKINTEVPSSVPQQDTVQSASVTRSTKKRGGKAAAVKEPPTKRRRRPASEELRNTVDPSPTEGDSVNERRTEDGTEIADDDRSGLEDSYVPQGMQGKKRRASPESAKTAAGPGSGTRMAKRTKTMTALNSGGILPTRVIAFWKGDGYYYPGTVKSMINGSSKFTIHFDDDTKDDVDIERIRASRFKVKDEIFLINRNRKAQVTDISNWAKSRMLAIRYNEGKEVIEMDINSTDFKIAARTLNAQWKDRTLRVEGIVPIEVKGPPSKSISLTSASTHPVKALSGRGFVLTTSASENTEREKATGLVKQLGGVVLDDWSEVYSLRGRCTTKRWSIKQEDIKYIYRGQIEQVFLLSDNHSAKPKFLTALALGIPCLSFDYLNDLLSYPEKSWNSYMLPAGFAISLNALVSQMVDLYWGNSTEHMRDIMSNLVPPRILSGKSVLYVDPEYSPKTTDGDDSPSEVGQIIISMGASEVEAVTIVKNASRKDLLSYDYVVTKDQSLLKSTNTNVVSMEWIKQCLMCGRLVPVSSELI